MGKIKQIIKAFIKNNPKLAAFGCRLYNRLPFNNRIRGGRGNRIDDRGVMKGCKITFRGKNNVVEFLEGTVLRNCSFHISGNNNRIIFDRCVAGKQVDLCTEGNGNRIFAGERTSFAGAIHLACIEGVSITIGKDCLFSSQIVFRTGDSHVVTDLEGNRINPSKDIVFGDHIWVGHRALINKGVHIGNDNIIGTGAIVTKSIPETNCVIAGVPAKVVKTGVNWNGER